MTTQQSKGTFIWHELMSRDPDASARFYEEVVGMVATPIGDDQNAYRLLLVNGRPIGGMTGPRPRQRPMAFGRS